MCDACRNQFTVFLATLPVEHRDLIEHELDARMEGSIRAEIDDVESEKDELEAWKSDAIAGLEELTELIGTAELTGDTALSDLGDKIVGWKQLDRELTKLREKLKLID